MKTFRIGSLSIPAVLAALAGTPGAAIAQQTGATARPGHAVHGSSPANPGDPADLVVLTQDDTVITKNATIRIPPGTVIRDVNGDGVLKIRGERIVVRFEQGSILRGAPEGTPGDEMTGIGIRVENSPRAIIIRPAVSGFKVGMWASRSDRMIIDGASFTDNFRQRLKSTPWAEDSSDWLWPHENDKLEWMTKYGAALYIDSTRGAEIRGVRVRQGQNGILLDRVTDSNIYDNDCSFLSGWGIGLWRSSNNAFSKNAVDFCIRGYSHGVYNRGQDSAGFLVFEQSSGNKFYENSATHSGNGFFGFSGREALGQLPAPASPFDYAGRGNTDNDLVANDFSYNAAHGVEATFSFRTLVRDNRIVENAICGVWGGYSQDTMVAGNTIERNGDMGYGLERGGVNIENGARNFITHNRFAENEAAVHLWNDDDKDLRALPWAKANLSGGQAATVAFNQMRGDKVGVHLRGTGQDVILASNTMRNVQTEILADDASKPVTLDMGSEARTSYDYLARGSTRPIGARRELQGRRNIIMTEWGPWDHQSPLVRKLSRAGGEHVFELRKTPEDVTVRVDAGPGVGVEWDDAAADIGARDAKVFAKTPGIHPYRFVVESPGGFLREIEGTLVKADWQVSLFPSPVDPREGLDAWRAAATGPSAKTVTLGALDLRFGNNGPSRLRLSDEITAAEMPSDGFGLIARTTLPLPPGTFRVRTLSDDGVRVLVNGRAVIENWTHHGPTRDVGSFQVSGDAATEIVVEYFELDGFAVLSLELERVDNPEAGG